MMKASTLSRALCSVVARECRTNLTPLFRRSTSFIKPEMIAALRPSYRYLCHTAISANAVAATSSANNSKIKESNDVNTTSTCKQEHSNVSENNKTRNKSNNEEDSNAAHKHTTTASVEEAKSLHVIKVHDNANADFMEQEMLLQQELQEPPTHKVWFPFLRQRGMYQIRHYTNVREGCQPDPLAFAMYAGRTDPEWIWLKILCWICVGSTVGTAVYAFFLPEHVKFFRDEPWSPLRDQA